MTDAARRILLGILLARCDRHQCRAAAAQTHRGRDPVDPARAQRRSVVMSAVVVFKPSSAAVRLFQLVMLLMIISGAVGMYLHLQANMEFQLEMDATLTGWALLKKSIVAKAPPALAPGAMMQLGLIGLAYTFKHPASSGAREDVMTRFVAFTLALLVAAPVFAQVGKSQGVVDANTITEAELVKLTGMTPAIAKALVSARPFDNITALNTFLLGQKLTQEQASALYRNIFVNINLNTATAAEIMLIPGAGKRMAHEFEEYRPWKSYVQFEKEIGKYVDAKEVARLARYTFIPLNLNTATEADFMTIPGAGKRMAHEFEEYRPWKTQAQFEKEIGKYVDAKEVKRFWRYMVIQ